ncbi:DUF1653 domain-containing protein [Patescibacteria group bacterium]
MKKRKPVGLSDQAKKLKPGMYRHHKNKNYEVYEIAIHSETLEELVVYGPLWGKRLMWVRPLSMFTETVVVDGETVPRFKYIRSK